MELLKRTVAGFAIGTAVLVLTQGCAHERDRQFTESMAQINRVEPPPFLTSGVANAFSNATFTVHVEVKRQPTDARSAWSGELFGRGGNLFFMASDPGKKQKVAGRLSALWDASTQKAYLLNDPLQAYAPITTPPPSEVVVTRDAANFPVTIQLNGPAPLTLFVSKPRMQAPPADMFALPTGFKEYASTDALLSELMRRRTEALDAQSRLTREWRGDPKLQDENITNPGQNRRPGL